MKYVLTLILIVLANTVYAQPRQAPPIARQAPPIVTEMDLYRELLVIAKERGLHIVVFVGFDGSSKYPELKEFCKICMSSFPGVEGEAVVVGKYDPITKEHIRYDLPKSASPTHIKLKAGLYQIPEYKTPREVPYYTGIRYLRYNSVQPRTYAHSGYGFSFSQGSC